MKARPMALRAGMMKRSFFMGMLGALSLFLGCAPSADDDDTDRRGSSSGGSTSGSSQAPVPDAGRADAAMPWPACSEGADCPNWYCDCASGPVNSAKCVQGRCLNAAEACPVFLRHVWVLLGWVRGRRLGWRPPRGTVHVCAGRRRSTQPGCGLR